MVEQVVPKPETEDVVDEAVAPPWMTILHNCDCHTFEQVVKQLQKAIACSEAEGWEIAWQVHNTGKAVVKIGPEAECVRVGNIRSEEHTSELQSPCNLVCRLLLEKKTKQTNRYHLTF